VDVQTSLRLGHVGDIVPKESTWTADFILSFRWTGETEHRVDDFRIANGEIVRLEKRESFESGSEHYAEYDVVARMTRTSTSPHFPTGDEWLFIDVEDASLNATSVRYVAEQRNSDVRPRAIPCGIHLVDFRVGTRNIGRPSMPLTPKTEERNEKVNSHFIFATLVAPDSVGIYQRLFRALFGAVAIALIVPFVRQVVTLLTCDRVFGLFGLTASLSPAR
jgi:hypothetical protein